MITTSPTKATRATITLGDIELDVFQLPDGKYFLSLTQVAETIGISNKRLSEFRELKLAQTLYPEGFDVSEKVGVEGTRATVSMISLDDVSKYWTLAAFQTQNPTAMALLAASQTEALERRADNAFDIVRTEEERNSRLKFRTEVSKATRRTLTDSIKEYIARHPELSKNYPQFIYSNCSDCLNLAILGARSKQIKIELDLKPTGLLRDVIPFASLRELEAIENLAGRLIDSEDLEPLEATKKALEIMHAKTLGFN